MVGPGGSEMDSNKKPRIQRAEGVTNAERYLKRLCDKTFLSLWCYPSIYRDQGRAGKGDGKEVCDLLVVCDNDIIIFSDKLCEFPRSGNLELDWCRWFRRTVLESANQVWGAERWIKAHPDRLFLDRACSEPFPLDLPDLATARFHRVVVAHSGSQRCHEELGQSGSLMLMPRIVGPMHYDPTKGGITPFAIGQIDLVKGYVHVFDDTTLDILFGKLDTVWDFVSYLTKKEKFVTSGLLVAAVGEEELLGHYLGQLNEQGEHDFVFPKDATAIALDEGIWETFQNSPERRRQLEADEISYTWDRIIEKFAYHIFRGTSLYNSHLRVADQVVPLRFMAREGRTRRRMLSMVLMELVENSHASDAGDPSRQALVSRGPVLRLPAALRPGRQTNRGVPRGSPTPPRGAVEGDEAPIPGRPGHRWLCHRAGFDGKKTEDVIYFDARQWTPKRQAEAEVIREDLNLLKTLTRSEGRFHEYPKTVLPENVPNPDRRKRAQSLRNSLCPCGSGKKFKRCHGR